jgi:SAM-dependent methyltransferase
MKRVSEENINTAPYWDHTWTIEPPWRRRFGIDSVRFGAMARVVDRVAPPVRCLLDVGGGRGEFLSWLESHRALYVPRVPQLIGGYPLAYLADLSRVGPRRALWADRVDVGVQARAEALPFADGRFDVVFAGEILEHVERPAELVAELARVARPGAWLSLSTPLGDAHPDVQHVWEFEPEDVEGLLDGAGGDYEVRVDGTYIIAHMEVV